MASTPFDFNKAFQQQAALGEQDPVYGQAQWNAWKAEEEARLKQGNSANQTGNCPPNKPFTSRPGPDGRRECAFKPDDCPEGSHMVGNDANGGGCQPNGPRGIQQAPPIAQDMGQMQPGSQNDLQTLMATLQGLGGFVPPGGAQPAPNAAQNVATAPQIQSGLSGMMGKIAQPQTQFSGLTGLMGANTGWQSSLSNNPLANMMQKQQRTQQPQRWF